MKKKLEKNLRIKKSWRYTKVLLAIFFFYPPFVYAQDPPNKEIVIDEIVAQVENFIITKSEVDKVYIEMSTKEELVETNTKCKALENIVINKLMVVRAASDSVAVKDEEVNANLDRRMQYYISQIGSEEKIKEYYGKSIEQIKEELRENVREQLIIQKMESKLTSELKTTPTEVRKFFKKIPEDSLPYFSTELSVGQIVREPKANEEAKNEIKRRLIDLKQRILNGEDFALLAKEYSDDPSAQRNGGELGFFKRGDLDPQYESTALLLKPGTISDPIESQFGFHIIQMLERRGNIYNSQHILMIPQPTKSDFEKEIYFLDSIRNLILENKITFEKAAKTYSSDKETSNTGGFFQDETGASLISVEQMDPVLFFTVDTMQLGNITSPITFKKNDGSDAIRIIYYKEKIPPHQANLQQDFQKIYTATITSKKNRVIQDWFSNAYKNVYITINKEFEYCKILK